MDNRIIQRVTRLPGKNVSNRRITLEAAPFNDLPMKMNDSLLHRSPHVKVSFPLNPNTSYYEPIY